MSSNRDSSLDLNTAEMAENTDDFEIDRIFFKVFIQHSISLEERQVIAPIANFFVNFGAALVTSTIKSMTDANRNIYPDMYMDQQSEGNTTSGKVESTVYQS